MGLPAIILTGVLLFVENYPFGNNNFALWDMDYQYLDFFQWLKRVVNGEANIAYSFGKSKLSPSEILFASSIYYREENHKKYQKRKNSPFLHELSL